jgi:virginiamycin B lyase
MMSAEFALVRESVMRLVFVILLICHVMGALEAAEIQEWVVPWEGSGPPVFDPSTEKFKRFDLDQGTGPPNLIVGDDGTVWYAGNRAAHIGKMDSASGQIEKIMMPIEAATDPHTLIFDQAGNIWFTLQHSNMIGRLAMKSDKVDLVDVKTPRARPYGIIVDPEGRPWIVLLGTNKLATVDPVSMVLTEIDLPRKGARPRRIDRTADGRIWYVDYKDGYLGAYQPSDQSFQEWPAPSAGGSGPYAMAVDAEDRIWFVETAPSPNTLVGFDPKSGSYFSEDPIPSGAGSVRHMVFDAKTNALWFGTDTNNLGRAKLP